MRILSGLLTHGTCRDGCCRRRRQRFIYHQFEQPGPLESTARRRHAQGRGPHRDRDAARKRGRHQQPLDVHCGSYLCRASTTSAASTSSRPATTRSRRTPACDQVIEMLIAGAQQCSSTRSRFRGLHQPADRRALAQRCEPHRRHHRSPAGRHAAARYLQILERGMARRRVARAHAASKQQRPRRRRWEQAPAGPAVRDAGGGHRAASIVEKETGARRRARARRGRVRQPAGKNMRLQSDPTILYGSVGGHGAWGRRSPQPRSTQKTPTTPIKFDGLPPTPICNPGLARSRPRSIRRQSNDLYFVADGTGGHVFSDTLKEHNAAVTRSGARSRARDSRSEGSGSQAAGAAAAAARRRCRARAPASRNGACCSTPPAPAAASAAAMPLPTRKPKQ